MGYSRAVKIVSDQIKSTKNYSLQRNNALHLQVKNILQSFRDWFKRIELNMKLYKTIAHSPDQINSQKCKQCNALLMRQLYDQYSSLLFITSYYYIILDE